jgi:hypothetical protein
MPVMQDDRRPYRALIDELVRACREGQGQIGAHRAKAGIWNANATPDLFPDQFAMNELLSRLSERDRAVLAGMLEQQFVNGVHSTLVALHEAEIPPFDEAYEGTPFHDFVGRLAGWEWPKSAT